MGGLLGSNLRLLGDLHLDGVEPLGARSSRLISWMNQLEGNGAELCAVLELQSVDHSWSFGRGEDSFTSNNANVIFYQLQVAAIMVEIRCYITRASDDDDAVAAVLTASSARSDAEHVSKNSPYFLERLLSKVENEQDVFRPLTRFLRYNPINEFEPFLESPSEVVSLLPQSLMFLNDDQVMLDNFHDLCDYGVPQGSYEELGLSKSTVIRLVSCCPSLLVGNVNKELIGILEKLKAWGFGNDWIGGYLSCKSTYNWNRMLETMGFIGEVGYSQTQMGSLFKMNPGLLLESSGKRIYILVGGLLKLDLKMSEIYSFFLQNPQILSAKRAKNVCRAVSFFCMRQKWTLKALQLL
ncbi:hypothetical protein RHSIM_Rhsim13G0130600 [Rhododendron simsii]|uniref:Uncharacterized protein n=1 Tax=Rhododendron simsii TaxID=118357 RepID=A0A834FZH6_RHOSS|nr:hypothetical protein RHSIM_Rhsim13G0130600 [Rhododendron simsii]